MAGDLDAAFLRLPLISDSLRRIPLWTEEAVVALSRESELTLLEEITAADLDPETAIVAEDDVLAWADLPGQPFAGRRPETTSAALDLVAHEAGFAVLPKAIARALHRRDVALRDFPEAPGSQVGLAWRPHPDGATPEVVETFIGIVRGRTPNSTRNAQSTTAKPPSQPRRTTRGGGRREGRPTRGGRRR